MASITSQKEAGFALAKIDRGGGRELLLYSEEPKTYHCFDGLPPVASGDAHLRWHPLRRQWVGHASARQGRTFLPNAADCPLCAMESNERPSDIPVDDYEIAIFTNRFSALSLDAGLPPELDVATISGKGACDVVSYSADHNASLASIGDKRIALLIRAVGDKIKRLYEHDDIIWALPFENRGREIGVTLDHPHGQIYSLSILPEPVKTQADAMAEDAPLSDLADKIDNALILEQSEHSLSYCPPWARYPFESWVMPHRAVDGPQDLTDAEIADLAQMTDRTAKRLDTAIDGTMPYTLAWQVAPKGYEGRFHFYLAFQPLKRAKTKQKYLASVEQITGLFLVDLSPERAARILRGEEPADD
ncbi:MAG: galactose-1-phosphate uridylyltransferase [Candidatus Puniceispirillaceae bacterium]